MCPRAWFEVPTDKSSSAAGAFRTGAALAPTGPLGDNSFGPLAHLSPVSTAAAAVPQQPAMAAATAGPLTKDSFK
jgi:hypothetical protein